ncbi:MAG TPA: glycosyltransferase [Bacteroidota bacterium]|jgi:cellulose synthase/poly-beta-1,6-N-acetylglucosamine synthase-like glycosyltransferase|nr:glycosyltransferase [Bacteroidota bacterium]
MLTTLLVGIILLYLIMMLVLRVGMERSTQAVGAKDYEPHVSIIVAARNEEQCIQQCIESLLKIDYPWEKLECIIVNDGSTDRTAEIAGRFAANDKRIKLLLANPGTGNLRGKANAVAQGIEASKGEILMFTDADCTVPATWARNTVQYFNDHVGVVGGFTVLHANGIFEGMQALDWIFSFGIASAAAGLEMPLSVIGNNLSVYRKAYDEVGGFQGIPFSVTEDYALVQAIVNGTKYRVSFPIDGSTAVRSFACQGLYQLFRQKQRWGVGGLKMVFKGIVIMSIGWFLRTLIIISAFLSPLSIFLVAVACMLVIDFRFLFRPLQRIGILAYFKYFLAFELYYLLYVPLLPIVAVLSKNIVWKERSL